MNIINKNFILCALGISMTTIFYSCDSFLDKLPDNRTELTDASSVSSLLISAYPSAAPAYLLEMESDNTDENISNSWTEASILQRQAYKWNDITENGTESPQNIWESCYSAISASNKAMEFIRTKDSTQYLPQLGEALLCRAYAGFTLSTVFCDAYNSKTADADLGLPYPIKTEVKVGEKYERGTMNELYKKIDKDIQEALPLSTDDYSCPKFHFNKSAAYAFATRFYLYYHDYDKVIKYATMALGSDATTKLRDWATWNALSQNDMIKPNAYVNSEVNANFLIQSVYSEWGVVCGPYLYGDKYAHSSLISQGETTQSSGPWGTYRNLNYSVFYNDQLSKVIVRKIGAYFEYTDRQSSIGYYHTEMVPFNAEETLLCRAEAYAISGQYQKSVDDINSLLSKFEVSYKALTLAQINAYYNGINYYTPLAPTVKKELNPTFDVDMTSAESLLQCILHLRRILTVHEGLRMQDIKRYGIVIYRRQINTNNVVINVTDTLGVDDPRRAIQIPSDVINAGMQPNRRNN
jgi:starch-binding outer membrane protein, SusD/RagB family